MTAVLQNRRTSSMSREKGEPSLPRYSFARVVSAEILSQFGAGAAIQVGQINRCSLR